MTFWTQFHGPNFAYVRELYEKYLSDPQSVDPATRELFEKYAAADDEPGTVSTTNISDLNKIVGTVNLAQAIREHGHLAAQLDPLGNPPKGDPALELQTYGLQEQDLEALPASLVGGPIADGAKNALEAINALRQVYSSTTGYDYDHVRNPEERFWLRDAAESRRFRFAADPIDPVALLKRLTEVEAFERFLHRIFPGKTRFSLEGLDMMIPIMDELVASAAEIDLRNILIGMAHRGRLNVLAHILHKSYKHILAEFKDPVQARNFRDDLGWTGDVKYHAGARRAKVEGEQIDMIIQIAPNPSHLEAVNPVVEGMARAAGTLVDQPGGPRFNHSVTLPLLIHGDAAFPGQGVVAETLNMSRIHGYRTGGTVHIIANNQLGYTTPPEASRSTLYASDMAKGFEIPIVHVNADDPEAALEAARLAFAYRVKFQKDFLIDLIGYRRYGHNEGDEPAFTQPLMYKKIEAHPTVREIWANTLTQKSIIQPLQAEEMVRAQMDQLQRVLEELRAEEDLELPQPEPPPPGAAKRTKTAVAIERLRKLNDALLQLPKDFTPHRKLQRAMQKRSHILENPDEASVEWAAAEELAFASILEDGIAIRLTGQDVERGTFSQRHATFYDVTTGKAHTPLQAIPQAKVAFEVRNSPLSEAAAIGFEYGYNVQEPGRLVVWEAQYGDFINGAQTHIDEFVTSARAKWGQTPSLVLLLPHAYEGQGPDHSSGRLERFLELAAETNMRIANATTAAQYFHLLRRQALLLQTDPLPLVLMTPKSLLRHPFTASMPRELAKGSWQPVLDDEAARSRAEKIRRVILCSGKIAVDLFTSQYYSDALEVAIVRVEQLYPFPVDVLRQIIDGYPAADEVVWVQEEPENMGAWNFARWNIQELLDGRLPLRYIGRKRNASPAEGSASRHALKQGEIIRNALTVGSRVREPVEVTQNHKVPVSS
ncbi:MAG TPA: 2-oxoglutarate dehydrogenase E1 component [Acidobacteriota bacterium]|nr:2-oxoglutarate dehydrogenase E1 component [Acidobacteriota bacterium]